MRMRVGVDLLKYGIRITDEQSFNSSVAPLCAKTEIRRIDNNLEVVKVVACTATEGAMVFEADVEPEYVESIHQPDFQKMMVDRIMYLLEIERQKIVPERFFNLIGLKH